MGLAVMTMMTMVVMPVVCVRVLVKTFLAVEHQKVESE